MKGVIFWELLAWKETLTAAVYVQQLENLASAIATKRPKMKNVLHDNARPHVAKLTREKLYDLEWEVLSHPPYSPDLAPSDYHLFRSMAHELSGQIFHTEEDVKTWVQRYFDSKPASFYERGIRDLASRWLKVVESDGEYVD
jgi:hypothetical protein